MISHLRVFLPAAVLAALVSVVAAPAAQAQADPAAVEQGCRQNLQRLFEAFEAYRRDHDGQYPPCVSAEGLWPELLKPYLKDAAPGRDALATDGPFYCPAIPAAERRASAADVSYGYNAIALGGGTRLFEPGKTRHHRRGPMHLVRQVPDPATTLLLVDCDAANKPGDGWYQAYPGTVTGRHDGKALVLFCDGHIEAVDPAKLNVGPPDTTAAPWRADLSTRRDSAPPPAQPPQSVDEALPAVTAVLSAVTPRIDGRVEAGEWDDATLFCGFRQYDGNVLAESDDMLAALSCSAEQLSVLFIMPAGKGDLMAKAEEHDGRVWRDDAVEFLVECGRADLRYHVMANSRGVRFDAKNGKAGWNGTWTAAGTRRAPTPGLTALLGGPADDLWVMELGIPLATLGVEPPTDGTVWRFNLCRDGQQHLVFAPTFNSHDDPAKFAAVTFRRPAAVLRLLGLGQPSFGKVAIQGQVLNRGDQPAQVRIEALLEAPPVEMDQATRDLAKAKDDETLQIQVARTADLTVAPGASAPLALAEDLTDKRLNRYRVRIVARSGDAPAQVLYANDGLFNPGGPLKVMVENLPSRQCVDLMLDTGALKNRAGLRTAVVVSDDAGRQRHTAMVSNDQPQVTVRVDYGAWPIGRYQVQAVLQSGDGATLAEAAAAFSRVSAPAWLDSRLGITDEVLPPWTPLEYLPGHTMRAWGREMRWGDALLPQGLHCRGVEILAEPMRVVLTAGGREARLVPEAVEVTRQDPSRAEFRTAGRAGEGLTFRAETWLEYDGLFWTTLTLHSAQPVEVSSLRLEVPLRPEVARYRLVDRDAGAVKPELERFEFAPVFTVGDAERGLSFACESQENWSLDYGRGAIEIEPREGHVVFRVNLVNKPCAFTGTRTYAFGFQPLPVKPLPPDWHSWRVGYYRSSRRGFWPKYARQTDVLLINASGGGNSRPYTITRSGPTIGNPMTVNDSLGEIVSQIHETGTLAVPYLLQAYLDNDPPTDLALATLQEAYLNEWRVRPLRLGPWSAGGTRLGCTQICLNSSYQDCLVHTAQRMITEYGVDGLYFDGSSYGSCQNLDHGCGWQDDKGVAHPTWSILATRRTMKRLYTLLAHAKRGQAESPSVVSRQRQPWLDFVIWGHNSSAAVPPVHSFITLRYDGEQFQGVASSGLHYKDLLSPDLFTAEFTATQTGIQLSYLAFSANKDEAETRSILAYLLPYGAPFLPDYLNPALVEKVFAAQDAFETRRAEFVPTWERDPAVTLAESAPDLLLAHWRRDGRYLVVVSNVGPAARDVTLLLPPGRGEGAVAVRDLIEDVDLTAARDAGRPRVTFGIPANTFRLLLATP